MSGDEEMSEVRFDACWLTGTPVKIVPSPKQRRRARREAVLDAATVSMACLLFVGGALLDQTQPIAAACFLLLFMLIRKQP